MKVWEACTPPFPTALKSLCLDRRERTAIKTYLSAHSHNCFYPAPKNTRVR